MFEIGDKVVHPQYGVGQIVKLEDREFERGDSRRYYEIHIPVGSTVWVPVDLSNSGLRGLARKSDLVRCREILSPIHRL
jgi:RNA polymerase-interacting CarD/CdnL/TRCF family regulator